MSLTGCRGLDMPLEITENLHVHFLFKIMFSPPQPESFSYLKRVVPSLIFMLKGFLPCHYFFR